MSVKLSDYLLKYHFKEIAEGDADDVKAAALQVIKAQDAALAEVSDLLSGYVLDHLPNELQVTQAVIKWLELHPTPPAPDGGK